LLKHLKKIHLLRYSTAIEGNDSSTGEESDIQSEHDISKDSTQAVVSENTIGVANNVQSQSNDIAPPPRKRQLQMNFLLKKTGDTRLTTSPIGQFKIRLSDWSIVAGYPRHRSI